MEHNNIEVGIFIYEINPIDFWFGWIPIDNVEKDKVLIKKMLHEDDWGEDISSHNLKCLYALKEKAIYYFTKHTTWEGDGIWRYSALPDEIESVLIISCKQDNNGTTYIYSPYPLPWLEKCGELTYKKVAKTI